jgi:SAM-dependent methyltransferase
MPTLTVATEFDEISPQYDATRPPLDAATLEGMVRVFRDRGVQRVLEIGVGTGRIARPLEDRGFEVTGLDASLGMMALARRKGIARLVRGSAHRLPFRDAAFDATLFVHVLHVLDDPPSALHEADRVGRTGAYALVHPRSAGEREEDRAEDEDGRRVFFRALARQGYEAPSRRGGPRRRERLILELLPPTELIVLSDRDVTVPATRVLEMFERRASRHARKIPEEALARALAEARAELGERTVTYRRVEALARWSRRERTRRRG